MTARERAKNFLESIKISTNVPLPISSVTCDVEILDDLEITISEAESEAYQRGMEDAAKIAERYDTYETYPKGVVWLIRAAAKEKK